MLVFLLHFALQFCKNFRQLFVPFFGLGYFLLDFVHFIMLCINVIISIQQISMSLNLLESEKEKTIERIKSETNLSELSKSMISQIQTIDSPLQIQLINMLGLNQYFIDKFVFKRKLPKYLIRKIKQKNTLILESIYEPPSGYTLQVQILERNKSSIPVCKFKPIHPRNSNCIIFAHGNASDLSDSIAYIHNICDKIRTQFIVFDYSGYGESRKTEVGEQIICQDLETVIAWACKDKKIQNIILWGFSLGTYPVTYCSTKYQVKATILQCPIASVCCLFQKTLRFDMKFKDDHFSNLQIIDKIKGKLLIMHSVADDVIPFAHAVILMEKFVKKNGKDNIEFLQVSKISHNALHRYISADVQNRLQCQVFRFIKMNIAESKLRVQDPQKAQKPQRMSKEKEKVSVSTVKKKQKKISLFSDNLLIKQEGQREISEKMILEIQNKIEIAEIPDQKEQLCEIEFQGGRPVKKVFKKGNGLGCFCFS